MNSQTNGYSSAENPMSIYEVALDDVKVSVQCVISATRIIGPIFFARA